jgi:hypothetical protein
MKKLRNFKCNKHQTIIERYVNDDVVMSTCECGSIAVRMISAPRSFGNTTGRSPSTRY